MTDDSPRIWIKIVPTRSQTRPGGGSRSPAERSGRWIEVARRTERFLTWSETKELYAPDIPEGYHAVSFARFKDNCW